jgi:AmmeMemoRadiSam system protein B
MIFSHQKNHKKRQPAVAGRFYPAERDALVREVETHVDRNVKKSPVLGIVAPHAGFMYSGDVAGAVYSRIEIPDTVILMGPNHTGQGEEVAVMTEGTWSMPMGDISIDGEMAKAICEETSLAKKDSSAHRFEHSLETQLPFLQYFKKEFQIVPICLRRMKISSCKVLSEGIVRAVTRLDKPVLLVASSDMTHYESHDKAETKDRKAITCIQNRDPVGLFETVRSEKITMCGVNPVTVMLYCSESLGAREAELVKYMTSGEVNGNREKVVGYAGMIIK